MYHTALTKHLSVLQDHPVPAATINAMFLRPVKMPKFSSKMTANKEKNICLKYYGNSFYGFQQISGGKSIKNKTVLKMLVQVSNALILQQNKDWNETFKM